MVTTSHGAHELRGRRLRSCRWRCLHGAADEGVPVRTIAEVIGRHLDLPVVAIAPEDAAGHFGWLIMFLAADIPASSALTRDLVGWQPTHPGLIDDLEQGHYFHDATA